MARTWLSIRVELVSGHGADLWPRPGRVLAAARSHSFAQLASAIDLAFARWDLAHLHLFTLSDATHVSPLDWWDGEAPDGTVDGHVTKLSRLQADEQFAYVFDMGDDWAHLCTVAEKRIDPLEELGEVPDRPVPYWGWGNLPDQYARRRSPRTRAEGQGHGASPHALHADPTRQNPALAPDNSPPGDAQQHHARPCGATMPTGGPGQPVHLRTTAGIPPVPLSPTPPVRMEPTPHRLIRHHDRERRPPAATPPAKNPWAGGMKMKATDGNFAARGYVEMHLQAVPVLRGRLVTTGRRRLLRLPATGPGPARSQTPSTGSRSCRTPADQ